MDLSVIICTYNRSQSLSNTLNSFQSQDLPKNIQWEIIVVDNNSTDDTKKVTEEFIFCSNLIVKYVKEENQGHSYARNRGIKEASGEFVCFTDDDVLVDKSWLNELLKTFNEVPAECVGGKILPQWPDRKPRWLKKELFGFLALLDYGNELIVFREFTKPVLLFGANMAFKKSIFDRIGFFDTNLGRKGTIVFGGDDIDIQRRIINEGGKIIYQPKAAIKHVISSERLKKNYFRRLHYFEGVTNGRLYDNAIGRHFCGIPFFIFFQFIRSIFRYLKNPTLRMQMNIWWFLGFMKGRVFEYKKGLASPI